MWWIANMAMWLVLCLVGAIAAILVMTCVLDVVEKVRDGTREDRIGIAVVVGLIVIAATLAWSVPLIGGGEALVQLKEGK